MHGLRVQPKQKGFFVCHLLLTIREDWLSNSSESTLSHRPYEYDSLFTMVLCEFQMRLEKRINDIFLLLKRTQNEWKRRTFHDDEGSLVTWTLLASKKRQVSLLLNNLSSDSTLPYIRTECKCFYHSRFRIRFVGSSYESMIQVVPMIPQNKEKIRTLFLMEVTWGVLRGTSTVNHSLIFTLKQIFDVILFKKRVPIYKRNMCVIL